MRNSLPPRLTAEQPRASIAVAIDCQLCRDAGYHRLGTSEWPGSAIEVLTALERGEIALCTCARGQWWWAWLTEHGHASEVAARNVPDTLAAGDAAIEWLRNFERRTQ